MAESWIEQIIERRAFPDTVRNARLIETHISWVILADRKAYKIKKPLKFSFLDFSTLANRKFYCQRELELNRRLAKSIYLGVLPIRNDKGLKIGGSKGRIVDYALVMKRLRSRKQMNTMIEDGLVQPIHLDRIASKMSRFHKRTRRINTPFNFQGFRDTFRDILIVKEWIAKYLGKGTSRVIDKSVGLSDHFLQDYRDKIQGRVEDGFIRDCHGDLHSRNIFLYRDPIVFDCIEFNDELREIDVLSEIAFLCMDLEVSGREDLSARFLESYLNDFPCIDGDHDRRLFNYYRLYRACVRAKVSAMEAAQLKSPSMRDRRLEDVKKYLELIKRYHDLPIC